MHHCSICFKLIARADGRCTSCQPVAAHVTQARAVAVAAPTPQAVTVKAAAPVAPARSAARVAPRRGGRAPANEGGMARWTVPLLGIALLGFSVVAAPNVDSEMFTPAARAALPDSDHILRNRKAEAAEASQALMSMLAELESAYMGGDAAASSFSATKWRERLDGLKGRYHIWGTVDPQHPDTHLENALHGALLLLSSTEAACARAAATGDWSEVVSLRDRFQANLHEATGL